MNEVNRCQFNLIPLRDFTYFSTQSGPPWYSNFTWFTQVSLCSATKGNSFANFALCTTDGDNTCTFLVERNNTTNEWQSLSCVYTPEYKFISNKSEQTSANWAKLTQCLSKVEPKWRKIHIWPLSKKSMEEILKHKQKKIKFQYYIYSKNWSEKIFDIETYWKNRPSQLRNTYNRKKRTLQKLNCQIEIYKEINNNIINAYWDVYNNSWKPREQSEQFINWLLSFCSKNNQLRLGIIWLDEVPIACQFWLVCDKKSYIFKLAQNKNFDYLSPGTVLMGELINHVIKNDKVENIDFLTGDDNYKKLWMNDCQLIYGIELFNISNLQGRILWYRYSLRSTLKYFINFFIKNTKI